MKANVEQRWKTYMTSLGEKIKRFSKMMKKDQEKLFHVLKMTQKYVCRWEQENRSFKDIQQRRGNNETKSYHEDTDQINKNEQHVMESILHITETADQLHEQMQNEIQDTQRQLNLLNENIETQSRQVKTAIKVSGLLGVLKRHIE